MEIHVDDSSKGIHQEILSYNNDYYSVTLSPSKKFSLNKLVKLTKKSGEEIDTPSSEIIFDNIITAPPPFKTGFFEDKNFPWIIINGNTDLLAKHRLTHDQIKELNGEHLAIFMFEPLFLRNRHGAYPQNRQEEPAIYSIELDSVQKFLQNHKHTFTATVFACDYGIGDYLHSHKRYLDLDIKTFDLFLLSYLGYLINYTQNVEYPPSNQLFSRHVICPNFRYQSARELMVAYIRGKGHHDKSYLTYFHRPKKERLLIDVPFAIEKTKEWDIISRGIKFMKSELPYTLDTTNSLAVDQDEHPIPDMKNGSNQRSRGNLEEFYHKSFVALVNETNFFSPCPEVSEKVLTPISVGRPFIIGSAAHSLRYLKEMGFKTFHDFWDESYDEEEDPYLRLKKIWKLLDWIYSLNSSELHKLNEKMKPVLSYNYEYLCHGFMEHQSEKLKQLVETSRVSCNKEKTSLLQRIRGLLK